MLCKLFVSLSGFNPGTGDGSTCDRAHADKEKERWVQYTDR